MSIKQRILLIPKYKKMRREDFLRSIDSCEGNFTGKNRDTTVRSDMLEKILTKYPEINAKWLITGDGIIDDVQVVEVQKGTTEDGNSVLITKNEYELLQRLSKVAIDCLCVYGKAQKKAEE